MAAARFVHLRLHTEYSIVDGIARVEDAVASGRAVVNLLEKGISARQILTKQAFENAITVVMALGGSTNAVLHLLAMAHAAKAKQELIARMLRPPAADAEAAA